MVAGLTRDPRSAGFAGLALATAATWWARLALSCWCSALPSPPVVMAAFYAPEPGRERLSHYYDEPICTPDGIDLDDISDVPVKCQGVECH